MPVAKQKVSKNWIHAGGFKKIRREYSRPVLRRRRLQADPAKQFIAWFHYAVKSDCQSPEAMIVSTVTPSGRPASRVALLKHVDRYGFVFFTSYRSPKARDLAVRPHATYLFFWPEIERQVRVIGKIKKVSAEESDLYFSSRPRETQIGAWVGVQSRPVESRDILERKFHFLVRQFKDKPVPRPPHWGGYRLIPQEYEFWQGGRHRLNDRFLYKKQAGNKWKIIRLMP